MTFRTSWAPYHINVLYIVVFSYFERLLIMNYFLREIEIKLENIVCSKKYGDCIIYIINGSYYIIIDDIRIKIKGINFKTK